jgi:PKD repeat protein
MPTAIFDSAFGTIDTYSWQFEGGVPSSSSNKIPGNIIYNNPGTFGITITAHNECGIFTLADSIEIINRPVITEFPQNISVCLSQAPVYFRARVNHQLANTGWSCDLSTPCTITDDGYFTPNQAGLFKINFMYGNIQNCTVDSSFYVTVIALPSVNAGLDTGNCIQNTNFHIEGNCQTNQHWWSCNSSDIIFNDTVNGDFTTTVPGNYLFTLHCKDTINYHFCDSQDQLIFQVDPLPVLVHQPDTFCVSINKSFDLLNIYFTNKCYWNFGDGHTDTTYSPNIIANHTYTSTGIYTVIINAFSRYGCNNSDTFNIVVIDAPLQPQFNFSNFNPANHCGDTLEVSIHFDHKMYDNSIEFSWLCQNNTFIPYSKSCFTDTTLYFVQSNYTDTIYTITVNLRNRCGILSYSDNFVIHPLPKAKFKQGYTRLCSPRCIEFSNKSIGLPDYYTWNWGDTTMPVTTNDSIVKHCFYYYGNRDTTYYVKLTALNDCGKDSIIDSILVLPNRTKAILNVDNASGCPPLTVHFNSEASFGAYFYLWKFGDGNNSSTLQNPEFIYTHSGQYNAYLWIASKDTCSVDSTQININVYDVPEFNFTINQDSICKKERLEIENYSNNLYGYTWDFGDNTYSTDFNPTHLYDTTGLFYIKLKGESLLHCSDSLIKKIYVKDSPTAFINPINDDCAPYIVSLIPDTTSLYYLWDFGDGSPHSANPFHVYNKPGVYIITLVSEASSNCTDTAYRQIRVLPTPKSSFMFDFQSAQTDVTKLPAYLQTYNQSGEATDYVWYLDNDSISTEINPQVEITTLGSHIITLRSFNEYGCSDDTLISYDLFFYKLYLPNALWFSSDIPEDRVFTPKGIGLTKYHIKIYDKWDNLMWESDKIENFEPAESWDGTFKNQRVMEGTYYWIITELEFVNGAPKPNNSYKNTGIINVIY